MDGQPRESEANGKVILFVCQEVCQSDLRRERLLWCEFRRLKRDLIRQRRQIRLALERGARVEPGIYSADLVGRHRNAYRVEARDYNELVIC